MLRDLLTTSGYRRPRHRGAVLRMLPYAWCWPTGDPDLAAAASEVAPPPPPLRPGQTLLVSTNPDEGRVALWALSPDRGESDAAFDAEVLALLDAAIESALNGLPLLDTIRRLPSAATWSVRLIDKDGPGADVRLRGDSFGLAMLLGAASALVSVPLRSDACFLASLDDRGHLGPVKGLEAKLRLLGGSALGVTTVYVHPDDESAARAAAAGCGRPLAVATVGSADAALDAAIPGLVGHLESLWDDGKRRRDALDWLFQKTVRGDNRLVCWDGVAAAADRLAGRTEVSQDEGLRLRAELARAIAGRHMGQPIRIDWAAPERFPELNHYLKLCLVAHVVQSAADGPTGRELEYVAAARRQIPPPTSCAEEHLRLLGAMGRTLAAVRHYDEALDCLRAALEGWAERSVAGSSHALCEYLRIQGLRGAADAVDAAREGWFAALLDAPETDRTSRAFAQLAAGRANVQIRRYADARQHLADDAAEWARAPRHVQAARHRWCARLARAEEREDDACRHDDALARDDAGGTNALLNAIDRARAGRPGVSLADALRAFTAHERGRIEWERLTAGVADPDRQAEILAEESRY